MIKKGDTVEEAGLTTPESLDLQKFLYDMKEKNLPYCTMEVSSSGLELNRVSAVEYDIAVVNNIARDHIDLHGSFENYFSAKKQLVANLQPGKIAILNVDCPQTRKLINFTNARVITYSVKGNDAMVQVSDMDLSTGKGYFKLNVTEPLPTLHNHRIQAQSMTIQLSVLGLHNVYNATSAAITGLVLNETPETIKQELLNFGGVERRFQLIYNQEYKIIDDHFANSGNISVTLETLRYMDYKNLKILYAIRGGRGTTVNSENAKAIVEWAEKLNLREIFVTSSVECVGKYDEVSESEQQVTFSILEEAGLKIHYFETLEKAIKEVITELSTGDVLLLAGCQGMDHGARIALHYIYNNLSTTEQAIRGREILAPLKNRVAGMVQ